MEDGKLLAGPQPGTSKKDRDHFEGAKDMRKKGQSWFLPLLVLFVMIWAIGKKDSPKTEPPVSLAPVSILASNSSPAPQPTQASAPEHFVNADKLNLRAEPGGKVISSLKRGEKVQVYEQKAEWARINLDGQPQRWISYKNLCSGSNCFVTQQSKSERATRSQFEAQHLNIDHRAPALLVVSV